MPERELEPDFGLTEGQTRWMQAMTVARLLASNGASGSMRHFCGVRLRAGAGPVRDAWLAAYHAMAGQNHKTIIMSADTPVERITGGIDIAATLASGKTTLEQGLLAQANGGTLIINGADRMTRSTAAALAPAIDTRQIATNLNNQQTVHDTAFTLIAIDESDHADTEHDHVPTAIISRLPVVVDLHMIAWHDICDSALKMPDCTSLPVVSAQTGTNRAYISDVGLALISELVRATSARCLRMELALSEIAALLAQQDDRDTVNADDIAQAAFITLGLELTQTDDNTEQEQPEAEAPQPAQAQPENNDAPDTDRDTNEQADDGSLNFDALQEMLVEAVKSGKIELPNLVERVNRQTKADTDGKSGDLAHGAKRGRPAGIVNRPPYHGARLNVIATLRAAAPWQKLRRQEAAHYSSAKATGTAAGPIIRAGDYRYIRFKKPTESTAIFAVDASGSTALDRLSEAKGAIEQLLADCYVRRDQVALVAFRGTRSEVLLEPTRSLARAKRSLTGLPGGGPTPLADGLRVSIELAIKAKQRGQSPLLVILTDGRGNIALDGTPDRQRAGDDARAIARKAVSLGIRTVFIDIAKRPRDQARDLATLMKADYCALPRMDSKAVSAIVSSYLSDGVIR